MEGSKLPNLTNPLLLLPIDKSETRCCCWAWNFLCYSTFDITDMPQNIKITWNSLNHECIDSAENEGCTWIQAYACERTNMVNIFSLSQPDTCFSIMKLHYLGTNSPANSRNSHLRPPVRMPFDTFDSPQNGGSIFRCTAIPPDFSPVKALFATSTCPFYGQSFTACISAVSATQDAHVTDMG